MPKVSVIMPVYNSERYLREAIDSILEQTFSDFEFIIIDDGSNDASPEIVRSYTDERIRFYQNERNMGVAATLNRGLDLATGEYIARMDSDDISLPERFEKQTAYLDTHPERGICGSSIQIFGDGQTERIAVYGKTDAQIRADMVFNPAFAHPSVMLRVSALFGMHYDCAYEKAEDYELWYRLLKSTKGYNIPEPLLRYRHHPTQVTQTQKPEQRSAVLKLHAAMLSDWNVHLSKAEYDVFLKICGGVRSLSVDEYPAFVSGGKKLIAMFGQGKHELTNTYSSLNRVIKSNSRIQNKVYFTWKEPVKDFFSKIKGALV